MSQTKKTNRNTIIAVVSIAMFLLLMLVVENTITPASRWSMLLVVLRRSAVYALVAVSLNLLNGFTGLFSLGHAGFMLIGAYAYAAFSIPSDAKYAMVYQYFEPLIKFSFPEIFENLLGGPGMLFGVFISITLAGLIAAATGFLVGLPVLRLKGNYLSIATLGFAEIIRTIFVWSRLGPITNGSNPLRLFTRMNSFFIEIGDSRINYGLVLLMIVSALCIFIIILLVNSSYGRAFKAIREDEIAAEAMGINLYKHKQISFTISCFFTGIGGALLAIFMGAAVADNFRVAMSYEVLLIVVLGGLGSISGSIIGAFLFMFSSEWWLRGLDSGSFLGLSLPFFLPGFRLVVFSVILLLVILFFRRGMMGDNELPYYIDKWRSKFGGKLKAFHSRKKGTSDPKAGV